MRRLTSIVLLVLAAVGIAATAVSLAAPGGRGKGGVAAAGPRAFSVRCDFSHRNTDDLIVFPGQTGRSHDHTYFGNKTTNASSTQESLRAATSTCARGTDTAAYWVPTLFSNGQAMTPRSATVYYRRRTADRVQAFPQGLRMIAGTSTATMAQPLQATFWNCRSFGNARSRRARSPPAPRETGPS